MEVTEFGIGSLTDSDTVGSGGIMAATASVWLAECQYANQQFQFAD